jgi:hypothetical protein
LSTSAERQHLPPIPKKAEHNGSIFSIGTEASVLQDAENSFF